eukprot:365664-Chlamydomonas_euryale.AAC.2
MRDSCCHGDRRANVCAAHPHLNSPVVVHMPMVAPQMTVVVEPPQADCPEYHIVASVVLDDLVGLDQVRG